MLTGGGVVCRSAAKESSQSTVFFRSRVPTREKHAAVVRWVGVLLFLFFVLLARAMSARDCETPNVRDYVEGPRKNRESARAATRWGTPPPRVSGLLCFVDCVRVSWRLLLDSSFSVSSFRSRRRVVAFQSCLFSWRSWTGRLVARRRKVVRDNECLPAYWGERSPSISLP